MVKLSELLSSLNKLISNNNDPEQLKVFSHVIWNLNPLLIQYQKLVELYLFEFSKFHRELSKLLYILLKLFNDLYKDGYCVQPEGEEGKGDGELQLAEEAGMGDGEGIKDVSDKMDNEEQALGEKYEENEKEEKDERVDPTTGIEMETEFEGKIQDVDQPQDEGSEKSEDMEEVELDKQMGDIDEENQEVLDEKLWNKDEDDEDMKENDQNIEGKKNLPDQEEIEEDIVAKEEDMPEKKDSKKNDSKEKEKKEKEKEKEKGEGEDEGEESGEEMNEDENGEEGDEEKERQDDYHDDMYDEKPQHIPDRENEEEFNLEDMALDASDGEGEEGKSVEEEEDENIDENEKDGENPEEQPSQDKEDLQEGETNETEQNDEGDQDDDEIGDNVQQLDELGEDEKNDDEDLINQPFQPDDQVKESNDVFGVKDNVGKPSHDVILSEKDGKDDEKDQSHQDSSQKKKDLENKEDKGDTRKTDTEDLEAKEKKSEKKIEDPNPYRSLGDAMKHWKKNLDAKDKKEQDKNKKDQEKTKDEKDKEDKDNGTFEYMEDGDNGNEDTQVLGNASDEQVKNLENLNLDEKEEEGEREGEDNMEEDEKSENEEEDKEDDGKDDKPNTRGLARELGDLSKPMDVEFEDESSESEDQVEGKKKQEPKIEDEENPEKESPQEIISTKGENKEIGATDENPLTLDDIEKMRNELMVYMSQWQQQEDKAKLGMDIWRQLQRVTGSLSQELCEQLRLILEPTQTSKLKGDFRTGKRLNMRKVIPYIASNFRKDKIWLRRSQPAKREYQILVGIDDSESVALEGAGELLREAVATIVQALVQLDVGQLSIAKFGSQVQLLHTFTEPFTDQSASNIFPQLQFSQTTTNIAEFLKKSIQILEAARTNNRNEKNLMQLMLVISDGRFGNDRKHLQQWLRRAEEQGIFCVFMAVDLGKKNSILDIKDIVPIGKGKIQAQSYMDKFPFSYYIVLRKIANLPMVLADALRQWFEMINNVSSN